MKFTDFENYIGFNLNAMVLAFRTNTSIPKVFIVEFLHVI